MRQRNIPASSGSSSDSQSPSDPRRPLTVPKNAPPPKKRDHHHDRHSEDEEEHNHDHPIDEEKLDNLLWEISKFCLPVGLFLYLSIYLSYRAELYKWFTRSDSLSTTSQTKPLLASISGSGSGSGIAATVDAPAPTAGEGVDRFEKWVKKEEGVAWSAMAANIGPEAGAKDGVVVAASSKGEWEDEPDYHFTWTRDAALIISTFLPRFIPPATLRPWEKDQDLVLSEHDLDQPDYLVEPLIRAYIAAQAEIQAVKNPSGDLWTGGLNEPNDGPALRALALIPYAIYILDRGYPEDILYVKEHLYDPDQLRQVGKVIKNDLEEVGGGWWQPGFDLWEEVNGHHLYTLLVSRSALLAGTRLARILNDTGAVDFYTQQASKIEHRLNDFWDEESQYYHASLPLSSTSDGNTQIGDFAPSERSGLDCAIPLAILHAGDEIGDWSAGDEKVLKTVWEYVKSFEGMYAVNKGKNWTEGWAVGRYKEDVYNGIGIGQGNPWFLCTFSIGGIMYRARNIFEQRGSFEITNLTLPFWSDILDAGVSLGQVTRGSEDYGRAMKRLGQIGDAFVWAAGRWATEDGRMSEQINRWDGSQVGARDLTWSYASFVSAIRMRRLSTPSMDETLDHGSPP